jgi:hypothetical protein
MRAAGEEAATRAVEAVRRRFENWRRDPGRGRRIPEELWQAAVELAARHGVWRTARALRLNNGELMKRLVATREAGVAGGSGATPFVELSPSALGMGGDWAVEIEDRKGTRLRVRLPGWVVPDLAALAREFLRSES